MKQEAYRPPGARGTPVKKLVLVSYIHVIPGFWETYYRPPFRRLSLIIIAVVAALL